MHGGDTGQLFRAQVLVQQRCLDEARPHSVHAETLGGVFARSRLGQAAIGDVSLYLIRAALAGIARVLILTLGMRMIFRPQARKLHACLNLLLVLAVPVLFW